MLHVLVSENQYFADFDRSARKKAPIDWIVPKVAAVGDDVVIFIPDRGLVACGKVMTQPHQPSLYLLAKAVRRSRRETTRGQAGSISDLDVAVRIDPDRTRHSAIPQR
jgi:hypothetical protein